LNGGGIMIREQVFRAMDNARDNGYDESHTDPLDVAMDIVTCDADLEREEPETLVPYVREWQQLANEAGR
jgi:hypothetical protein